MKGHPHSEFRGDILYERESIDMREWLAYMAFAFASVIPIVRARV